MTTHDHTSTHQDTISLTPDQLAKVITHTEQVKTNDGRGLNHLIRDNITAAIVAGEPVHTVCGVTFYPRAMTPDGKVRRTDWETCHACWATWLLEHHHGLSL